ncbi:uncharacterized protein LOC126158314 [Schistocerca cancellata]|uniref:uncharacterized protein LOC126158314 n=1 Tax=Schistocerca cancellata TaxID=274614 RepID=UPI002118C9B2|nr:uncharacterized protein LOC126158314 [Schistocerca cancellata]
MYGTQLPSPSPSPSPPHFARRDTTSVLAFLLDQQKMFKILPKIHNNHFELKDSFTKMKVKVAAAQLSDTVAAVIETYVAFNILPAEAMYTAEFVEKMDCLFDSLNSSYYYPQDGKSYKCALSAESPHIEMWYSLLKEMENWKVLELGTGRDKTNMFSFISAW